MRRNSYNNSDFYNSLLILESILRTIVVGFCALNDAPNLKRDVVFFCVHALKFLMVILDNKVFQLWIICGKTQIIDRDVDFLRIYAQEFQITIYMIP